MAHSGEGSNPLLWNLWQELRSLYTIQAHLQKKFEVHYILIYSLEMESIASGGIESGSERLKPLA